MFTAMFFGSRLHLAVVATSNHFAGSQQQHNVLAGKSEYGVRARCDVAKKIKPIVARVAGEAVGLSGLTRYAIAGALGALIALFFWKKARNRLLEIIGIGAGLLVFGGSIFGAIISVAPNSVC